MRVTNVAIPEAWSHAFEIADHVHHCHNCAQITGRRLLGGDNAQAFFFDIISLGIDV
jgi:hypothetical protein